MLPSFRIWTKETDKKGIWGLISIKHKYLYFSIKHVVGIH